MKSIFCTGSIVALIAVCASPVMAADRFFFGQLNIEAGVSDHPVLLRCDNDAELFGFSVAFDFDPATIAITGAEPTDLTADPLFLDGDIDNTTGRLSMGLVMFFSATDQRVIPPGSNQEILRINIDELSGANGSTTFHFRDQDPPPDNSAGQYNTMSKTDGGRVGIPEGLIVEDGVFSICSQCEPPAKPACVLVAGVNPSGITVGWQPDGDPTVSYEVDRRLTGEPAFTTLSAVGAGQANFTDLTAIAGIIYEYRVRAMNTFGESQPSDSVMDSVRNINLEKGKAVLGKKGWKVKFSRGTFDYGTDPYNGTGDEIVVTLEGQEYFRPADRLLYKPVTDKKTGLMKKIIIKDVNKNKLIIDFKKLRLKLTMKNLPEASVDALDGSILMDLTLGNRVASLVAPTLDLGKGTKFNLNPVTGSFASAPGAVPCSQ